MGSVDHADDRTFKVDFSGDGLVKLRENIMLKMKEFMGDYTDDTLVDYVIVLLRNGRRKDEAKNELNVFLGDDSDSFISWLWDHLASNMDVYVEQPTQTFAREVPKTESMVEEPVDKNVSPNLGSDSDRRMAEKISTRRRNRDWKGLANDETRPLRSEVSRVTHSPPQVSNYRKRSRTDDHKGTERDAAFQVSIAAPRRLLQFAMRDAVATTRPSNAAKEPLSKRLRSVVSTSNSDKTNHSQHLQLVSKVPNPMATVLKAVSEAAEDVIRAKSSSVFDRLGRESHNMDLTKSSSQVAGYKVLSGEDEKYEDMIAMEDQTYSATHLERSNYRGKYTPGESMFEPVTGLASDSTSESDGYDDVNVLGHRVFEDSWTAESGVSKGGNSLLVPIRVAEDANDVTRIVKCKQNDQPSAVANSSRDIVNISVNVNTWKPPYHHDSGQVAALVGQKFRQESELRGTRSGVQVTENGEPAIIGNKQTNAAAHLHKDLQKPPLSATGQFAPTRPSEDADARTIFVSNVHFAATKDSLSRHFNKFGEVVKVIIVTDATTGLSKGSAYVEFMRKEAADNALSLDGTSFMSRILKVVRKNASHSEGASIVTWPSPVRGSPFPTPRFSRAPFPRGMAGSFRPRPPIKLGARSMQWKRDGQATVADNGGASLSGNSTPSFGARSLTYVRTESKLAENLGST